MVDDTSFREFDDEWPHRRPLRVIHLESLPARYVEEAPRFRSILAFVGGLIISLLCVAWIIGWIYYWEKGINGVDGCLYPYQGLIPLAGAILGAGLAVHGRAQLLSGTKIVIDAEAVHFEGRSSKGTAVWHERLENFEGLRARMESRYLPGGRGPSVVAVIELAHKEPGKCLVIYEALMPDSNPNAFDKRLDEYARRLGLPVLMHLERGR